MPENNDDFKVPALKNFEVVDLELLDPEKAEEEAKKLRNEILPELQKQVAITLTWLSGMAGKSREAQELVEKQIAERQQWLKEYLSHYFGPYRRTTWLAYFTYHFRNSKSRKAAQKLMDYLCEKGYFAEEVAGDGPLKIFGITYSVSETTGLDKPEIHKLQNELNDLNGRILVEERMAYKNETKAMLSEGNLSTSVFLEGKPGLYSVVTLINGSPRPQGVLLVRSNGKGVFPHKAIGDFKEKMEELKALGKFLRLYTLTWESISEKFFTEKAQFSYREAELMVMFWKLLKNGMARKVKKEWAQAIRENCKAYAVDNNGINPEEFLIEKKNGFCFLELEGTFEWYDTKIYNLFFVAERCEENSQPVCRVVNFPPWLGEFFSGCCEHQPEGDKFGGLPQNLRIVLQKIRWEVEKHSAIESHA